MLCSRRFSSWRCIAVVLLPWLPACSLQDFDGYGAGASGGTQSANVGSAGVNLSGAGGGGSGGAAGSSSAGGTFPGGGAGQGGSGGGQGGTGPDEWQPLEVEPVPENALFADASFEDGIAGWAPIGNIILEHDDDRPHSGQYHLRVRGRADYWNGPGYSLLEAATANGIYLVSVWLRSTEPVNQKLTLRYTCVAEATQYTQLYVGQVLTSWTQLQASLTVPECELVDLTLLLDSPEQSPVYDFDVDDVYIVPDPSQVPVETPAPAADAGANGDAGTDLDAGTGLDASADADASGGS